MHNLFLTLNEALTWVAANTGATLTLTSSDGAVRIEGLLPSGQTRAEPFAFPAQAAKVWAVPAREVHTSLVGDVVPVVSAGPVEIPLVDRISTELRLLLNRPMGSEFLTRALNDANDPLTVAIQAKAQALQAKLDAGESIEHTPAPAASLLPDGKSIFSLLRG